MEKRGKTHPLYCISDFVIRVSSAAIPDRYSLSFNDRVYICMYTYICKRVAWKSVIYGANVHPRNVLSRTYPREKRQTAKCSRVVEFSGDAFVTRRYCVLFIFFLPLKRIFREFKLWEIFSDTYKIFRRGYKKDSRKGVGWNWLERKFVLISCWMIVICFFFWEMKRVYKKYREFLFLFFFLNKERDEF